MKYSEIISDFLNAMEKAITEYNFAVEAVEKENKHQQDLLHDIEFEPKASERNKLCTVLHRSRIERRRYKDIMEEAEPLITFFQDQQNIKVLDKLKQVLGAVRKAEAYHENRTYNRRYAEDEIVNEITGKEK